jgi:hypothetical protein
MPNDPSPLSESEQFQLNQLLDRRAESLPEAQRRRDRERAEELKLRAERDRLAASEARLSRRLASLRIDIDVVTARIHEIAPSQTAFRFVAGKLKEFGEIVPAQSYFNTAADNLDQEQLLQLGEIALSLFEASTRPKGVRPLRERMQEANIEIGPDGPRGDSFTDDPRTALAARIVAAGEKARGKRS